MRRLGIQRLLKRAGRRLCKEYGRLSIARHGFWYVSIPRTSSSSIQAELRKHFGVAYGKQNMMDRRFASPQVFPGHMVAEDMRSFLGPSLWDKIFTFSMVRNPWDRTCSMYHYRRLIGDVPGEWSFRDYVLGLRNASSEAGCFAYHGYRYGLSDYLLGETGEMLVDFVARYENRAQDMALIAKRLNIVGFGELHIQNAMPSDSDYSGLYDSETMDIVGELYAKDIELFGYTFEK